MYGLFDAEPRGPLGSRDEEVSRALDSILRAIRALESLPAMGPECRDDARSRALISLHEAFVNVYRAASTVPRVHRFG